MSKQNVGEPMKIGDRYRFGGRVIEIDDILKDQRGRGKGSDMVYYRASDGGSIATNSKTTEKRLRRGISE